MFKAIKIASVAMAFTCAGNAAYADGLLASMLRDTGLIDEATHEALDN